MNTGRSVLKWTLAADEDDLSIVDQCKKIIKLDVGAKEIYRYNV